MQLISRLTFLKDGKSETLMRRFRALPAPDIPMSSVVEFPERGSTEWDEAKKTNLFQALVGPTLYLESIGWTHNKINEFFSTVVTDWGGLESSLKRALDELDSFATRNFVGVSPESVARLKQLLKAAATRPQQCAEYIGELVVRINMLEETAYPRVTAGAPVSIGELATAVGVGHLRDVEGSITDIIERPDVKKNLTKKELFLSGINAVHSSIFIEKDGERYFSGLRNDDDSFLGLHGFAALDKLCTKHFLRKHLDGKRFTFGFAKVPLSPNDPLHSTLACSFAMRRRDIFGDVNMYGVILSLTESFQNYSKKGNPNANGFGQYMKNKHPEMCYYLGSDTYAGNWSFYLKSKNYKSAFDMYSDLVQNGRCVKGDAISVVGAYCLHHHTAAVQNSPIVGERDQYTKELRARIATIEKQLENALKSQGQLPSPPKKEEPKKGKEDRRRRGGKKFFKKASHNNAPKEQMGELVRPLRQSGTISTNVIKDH